MKTQVKITDFYTGAQVAVIHFNEKALNCKRAYSLEPSDNGYDFVIRNAENGKFLQKTAVGMRDVVDNYED